MCAADANLQCTRVNRSFLGGVMDSIKLSVIIHVTRKYVAPVALGALVVWLVANELGDWADVVCSVAGALAIAVEACAK
jgi:hypothetical protein